MEWVGLQPWTKVLENVPNLKVKMVTKYFNLDQNAQKTKRFQPKNQSAKKRI
jgi:hypothetical protein